MQARSVNRRQPGSLRRAFRRDWQLWLLVLPALATIILFCYVPMYGIRLAFHEYSFVEGITGGKYVGLKYFEKFVTNPTFVSIIGNTLKISLTSLILGFPVPIFLALLFNQIQSPRRKRLMQTIVYMPHFISTVVMVAILRMLLNTGTGIISETLKKIGLIDPKLNLMGAPKAFLWVYVLSGIWQEAGWGSIIYLAALSGVDRQLYEAAEIDGANRFQLIVHIDIPTILPTIVIMLILTSGSILSVGFDKVWLMRNGQNAMVTNIISTYTYSMGMEAQQFSYSTAIGLFNAVVNFVVLVSVNLIARKASDMSLF